MHLTAKCTKLSYNALSGIKEMGMNILLLCNTCVSANQQEKIKSLLAKPDKVMEEKIDKMEHEMKELKETVSEIENILSKPAKQPEIKPNQKESNLTTSDKNNNKNQTLGTRIRGVKESNDKDPRKRQEHDFCEVQKILTPMEVECKFNDLIRLGQRGNDRDRPILLKLPNLRLKRLILSSTRKLKNYGAPVFISKELTNEEAAIENESLKKKRELIDQEQNKKDFSVRDGKLNKRDGNQCIVISPKSETTDNN